MTTAAQIANLCNGEIVGDGNAQVCGACIDSRKVKDGEMFVALRGEQCDGNDFVADAKANGAAAALVSRAARDVALTQIVASDCIVALGEWARKWRAQWSGFAGKLAAVTGSNGKTTVKGMLAAVAAAQAGENAVCISEGNLNNHLGLPLSLLNLREEHRYAVMETGMDAPGELLRLGEIAAPDVAVITNAQRAHLQAFGGEVAGVARAKGELLQSLSPNGRAVINADDKHCKLWRDIAKDKQILTFGFSEAADVHGRAIDGGVNINGVGDIHLSVAGEHNAKNAIAAAAAAQAMDIGANAVREGLQNFRGVGGRLEFKQTRGGATIIDDTYNANPDSMSAALAVLQWQQGAKFAALGDMLALGEKAEEEHRNLGAQIPDNIRLFAVGEMMRHAAKENGGRHFGDKQQLAAALKDAVEKSGGKATVLIKGSRGMKMETVAEALLEGAAR